MKYLIIKLAQFKQWILSIVMRCFNIYPYEIEHEGDGMYEYDAELFKEEKPYLLKTLKRMRRAGVNPNIDDMVCGLDNLYYIKTICYYDSHCTFWVDDEKARKNNA